MAQLLLAVLLSAGPADQNSTTIDHRSACDSSPPPGRCPLVKVVPLKLAMVSLVAVALSVAAQANAEPFTLDADRASFLAAVG